MNPEVKKKWVKALKSGKYIQVCDVMKADTIEDNSESNPAPSSMCVMGVLADLAFRESGLKYNEKNWFKFSRKADEPTERTLRWAGITDADSQNLMSKNDDGSSTFTELANYIEENL